MLNAKQAQNMKIYTTSCKLLSTLCSLLIVNHVAGSYTLAERRSAKKRAAAAWQSVDNAINIATVNNNLLVVSNIA